MSDYIPPICSYVHSPYCVLKYICSKTKHKDDSILKTTHYWEFLGSLMFRISGFDCCGSGFNLWSGNWAFHKPPGAVKMKSYPLFYHVELGIDTICLHVSSSTVLSMHICTYTNRQRYKAERHKTRTVMIILLYNLHIFSLSVKWWHFFMSLNILLQLLFLLSCACTSPLSLAF